MAGGLWLVTSAGAAGGAIAGGGGMLLFQLGSAAAVVELTKAQVSFKHIVMADQVERRKAQEYIGNLTAQKAALEQKLAEEQVLNDKKAVRIHELEKTIKAVEESIEWMQSQANEAA